MSGKPPFRKAPSGEASSDDMDRRSFVRTAAAAGLAAGAPPALLRPEGEAGAADGRGAMPRDRSVPAVHTTEVRPVVLSDRSGYDYRNGGPENAVERAFRGMTQQEEDVLDALVAGVNIAEADPEEMGVGYGGVPNADGVVQLDACCMHGPTGWAGGVAAMEGVRAASSVARAVMEHTDHHLLAGDGAREFARQMGFPVEESLATEASLERWREWKRRIDPEHWLDPEERGSAGPRALRRFREAGERAGLSLVREGVIPESAYWGTVSCEGIDPAGRIAGVTTTSGLSFKIPGRVGDSPILGAGQYVDGAVGAAGSTGRGEANLSNLSTHLIVEEMRRGAHPKDAGMAALRRIRDPTSEARLLNDRGLPAFDVRFFVLNRKGEYAGVALYGARESRFAVCDENGSRLEPLDGMLEGAP